MKIYRPLWSEGAFLAPQQFQQQTRWDAYVADVVAHMSLSSPWGVISAEFDESALTVSRLNPVNLVVRFPDGTLVDTGISDNLPPACDLSHLTGYNSVDIVLALPLLSANGGNLSSGNGVSRPCRWQQEWLPVQDLSGQERTDMAVLRHAITLRYAHDDNSAYLTCPVACLIRNAQGQTAQLNSLDERKGKYLTGSELKSAIFTIRRQLDQSPPTEELLRQIDEELKKQGSV